MKKKEIILENYPSLNTIELYKHKWDKLISYPEQERALDKLFFILCPDNKCLEDIMIKCSTLNDFYSTRIFNIKAVAQHILELNIDERLRKGDANLVTEISHVNIVDKNGFEKLHVFYSFATKYCSHHQPSLYSIYDTYVHKLLKQLNRYDNFYEFTNEDLRNYPMFIKIIDAFRKHYGLESVSLKDLDKYLWQLGKKAFNRDIPSEQKL